MSEDFTVWGELKRDPGVPGGGHLASVNLQDAKYGVVRKQGFGL